MKALLPVALACVLFGGVARAQQGNPLPQPPETKGRLTSTPGVYERESAFKKKYADEASRRQELEKELERLRARLDEKEKAPPEVSAPASTPAGSASPRSGSGVAGLSPASLKVDAPVPLPPPGTQPPAGLPAPKAAHPAVRPAVIQTPAAAEAEPYLGDQPMVFTVSAAAMDLAVNGRDTAVPTGSYVKARMLTGVEANALEAYPVLLQLDYAFVGPNKTRIDLSHCFVIAKAKANLSTERVLGETQQISCVRNNNEIVTRPAKGYLAGEDSTFGVTGELISHQGQVFLTAVLASLAKGVGEAVALAQTTTQVVTGGVGGVATAQNITGDKLAYVGGKAVSEPATLIANWYLKYAEQLVPSIAVGSGRDIWIVLLDTVRVPDLDIALADERE